MPPGMQVTLGNQHAPSNFLATERSITMGIQ